MVNGVPREVPRPKPEGPGPKGFWPRDFPRDSIHHVTPKAFPQSFIFMASPARIRDFFQPMDSVGSPLDIIPGLDSEYW